MLGSSAMAMAGRTAPNRLPKCGVPVLCTPVRILAIGFVFDKGTLFHQKQFQFATFGTVKKLLLQLWRAWFYIVAGIPVLILFPFLVFILLLPNAYPIVFWIARNIWAPIILTGCGFYTKVRYAKPLPTGTSYVLVANHTSYIDPFVMLRVSKNPFVFVGKKELVNIPFLVISTSERP